MILRKPYALLIKNFKKIHIVLGLLMVYISFKSSAILTFFNDYIKEGSFESNSLSLSSSYINIYIFLCSILIAAIAVIIFILMRQKQKPKIFYMVLVGFYIGIIVYFFEMYNVFEVLDVSTISPRSLRVIRDLSTIFCYTQYGILLFTAIRAFGFNIRKFNFGEDLEQMQIEVTDNEEFELTVGIDSNKVGASIRKWRREFKYFVVENIFVLSLITLVFITSISIIIFLNVRVYNRVYKEGESFKTGYFINEVKNSYYTHLNQMGIKITKEGKAYIVVLMNIFNTGSNEDRLDPTNISLVAGNNIYSPVTNRYGSFVDLGTGYSNQGIKPSTKATYIFVFEIEETDNTDNLFLRYRESIQYGSTNLVAKYKKTKLNVIKSDILKNEGNADIGKNLKFTNSLYNKTSMTVNDVQVANSFIYLSNSCNNGICATKEETIKVGYLDANKTLIKLSATYFENNSIVANNAKKLSSFISEYGYIKYTINGKTYKTQLINKTPINCIDNNLYYQTSLKVSNAQSLKLVIHIRNKEYIFNLIDKA